MSKYMKFYNPFKPHITELRGKFYVRKLDILRFGWIYVDRADCEMTRFNSFGWWSTMNSFSEINTLNDAVIIRNNIPWIEATKREIAKVKVHL